MWCGFNYRPGKPWLYVPLVSNVAASCDSVHGTDAQLFATVVHIYHLKSEHPHFHLQVCD